MKFFVRCFCIFMLLPLSACRSVVSEDTQRDDSELQAVYDHEYALRLAKVNLGGESVYRFESCFSDGKGGLTPESCVVALRFHSGEEVTLALQNPSDLEIQQEATMLSRWGARWQHYRAKLPSDSELTVGSVILGGSAMLGALSADKAAGHGQALVDHLNSQILKGQPSLEPNQVAVDSFYGTQRYRPFATLEKIEDAVQIAESELRRHGLDPTKMPQVSAPELQYGKDLIVSKKFQDFFLKEHRSTLKAKGLSSFEAFQDPFEFTQYKHGADGDLFHAVVHKYLKQGHRVSHIFKPGYFNKFKAFYLIEEKLYLASKEVTGVAEAIKHHPAKVFHRASSFVLYKGASGEVLRRVRLIKEGTKAIALAKTAAKVITTADAKLHPQKAQSKQLARLHRKIFSAKMLRGLSLATVGVAAVMGGVLVLEKAGSATRVGDLPSFLADSSKVFIDYGTALTSTDDSQKAAVLSVQQVLINLGTYLQSTAWLIPGASIEFYCLPDEPSGVRGMYQQKCQRISRKAY